MVVNMNRQFNRRHINKRNEVLQTPPTNMQMALEDPNVRMSPLMELTIVGGLGVFIMIAPNIASFMKEKFQHLKTRVILLKNRMGHSKITKKLEMLNRRRKYGSIVRVIGSILPSAAFTPPCRIYIPNWVHLENNQWGFPNQAQGNLPIFEELRKSDLPSENDVGDGLIEAFEIASEIISSVSDEEDIDEDEEDTASSSPEGWIQDDRKLTKHFNPTLIDETDSSYARCSTPRAKLEILHFNASQIANQQENSSTTSKIFEDQTDITDLKKMVEGLMLQINCLNQSLLTTQTQLAAQSQNTIIAATQQPKLALPQSAQLPVSTPTSVPTAPAGPPPPPPPPPPMPPMPTFGNKPLVITKKGNQDKLLEKKPQMSLSDVLKELPNAKLRRIERSPGGTPLKPQLKLASDKVPLDIGNQLAFALRKRYESMHSPLCETDTDKENMDGSDDSFDDTPVSAKRILFPSAHSPLRRSSGSNQQTEKHSPFGQHMLKKRTPPQKEFPAQLSPLVLRNKNQN